VTILYSHYGLPNHPPYITNTLPVGSDNRYDTNLSFSIYDDDGMVVQGTIDLTVTMPLCPADIPVIVDGVIQSGFTGTILANPYGGYDVSVIPDRESGWGERAWTADAYAEDDIGAMASANWSFGTVVAIPDTTPPVVDNFVPTPGSQIDDDQVVQFDVTDDSGVFTRKVVVAKFPNGREEVIHNGDAFNEHYAAYSSRTQITDGFRYFVRRTAGWYGSILTIRVFAIDAAGNEAS